MTSEKYFKYSSYPELWTKGIRKLTLYQILRNFVKILAPSPNDLVLEVGCGEGRFISLILEKKSTYIGSDISTKMLLYAKERVMHRKEEDVHFLAAEAKHLPLRSKSVNKCFSYATVFFIPRKCLAIREMERVCKDKILVEFRNILNPTVFLMLVLSRTINLLMTSWMFRRLILTLVQHVSVFQRSKNAELWVRMAAKDRTLALEPYFPDSPLKIRRYFTKPFKTYTNIESRLKQCSVKTWFFKPTIIVEAILQS